MATTTPAADGWRSSLGDLKHLEQYINATIAAKGAMPLQDDHRDDLPAVGKITRTWIGPLDGHPGEHALFVDLDVPDGVSKTGLSVAFFGYGYSTAEGEPDVLLGYHPGTLTEPEVHLLLNFFDDQTDSRVSAVREYRQHSIEALAAGVWFLLVSDYFAEGLTKTVVDGIVDRLIGLLYREGKPRVGDIKIKMRGDSLAMRIPVDANPEVAKKALHEAFKTLRELPKK